MRDVGGLHSFYCIWSPGGLPTSSSTPYDTLTISEAVFSRNRPQCQTWVLAHLLSSLLPPALHFVDQHRAALIARVTDVDGVLDALHSKVLTEEQYQAVRAETTNPMKMRRLFSFAPAWNLACKNLLLQALRDSQPYLVADLES